MERPRSCDARPRWRKRSPEDVIPERVMSKTKALLRLGLQAMPMLSACWSPTSRVAIGP